MVPCSRIVRVGALAVFGAVASLSLAQVPVQQAPLGAAVPPSSPSQSIARVAPSDTSVTSATADPGWEDVLLNLPVVRYLTSLFGWLPLAPDSDAQQAPTPVVDAAPSSTPLDIAGQQPALPPCSVAALDPIEDPAALALEQSTGSAIDVQHMVPAAAKALDRFQSKVSSIGGSIVLKSAYRPEAYQRHLQNVWYKWMDELRNNYDPACQDLRAQVQEEFTRHRLIETQHPVTASDHTRGLAFDATVDLPANARLGRRRMTLDRLAHLSGLVRPAIASDPVHFKYLGLVRPAHRG